ncbi:MAG TPA: N-methyl-L-tryptophan oxidase [Rhizomicrobium sp.]
MDTFDVAVIGLGAAGSAALAALARAGAKVIGIDRYAPPHALGSSHGETRLLRTAYSEGAAYVPMVLRAITLWQELEARTHTSLFQQQGVFYCGPPGERFLDSARQAAARWNLPVTAAPPLPQLAIPQGWQCFEERDGGFILAEPAIAAFLADARSHGARILSDCRCGGIDAGGARVTLDTSAGALAADRVVVTTGAWIDELVPQLRALTYTERRVLHWFEDTGRRHTAGAGFKPFAVTTGDDRMIYGFPANAAGEVKVGEHFSAERIASPDTVEREISARDVEHIVAMVAQFLPGLGRRTRSTVCFYPMSWDEHFIIDRAPNDPRIVIGAGLSGHGFKFAPVIGEALANMALARKQEIDVGFFSLARRAR